MGADSATVSTRTDVRDCRPWLPRAPRPHQYWRRHDEAPKPKELEIYTGLLTPRQAAGGINRAFANARRLTAYAELLIVPGRWPSAASMAVLALEEIGKMNVLRAVSTAPHTPRRFHGRGRGDCGRPRRRCQPSALTVQ